MRLGSVLISAVLVCLIGCKQEELRLNPPCLFPLAILPAKIAILVLPNPTHSAGESSMSQSSRRPFIQKAAAASAADSALAS